MTAKSGMDVATVPSGAVALSDLLSQALGAFTSDVSYAVAMTGVATTIENKRVNLRLRTEVRRAEAVARKQCAVSGDFFCSNPSPCGVGQCPFAKGDLAGLRVDSVGGTTVRPQESLYDDYSIDQVVAPLRKLRGM